MRRAPRFELCVTFKDRTDIVGDAVCIAFLVGQDGTLTQLGCSNILSSGTATPCCQVDFVFDWPQTLRFVVFKIDRYKDDGDGMHTLSSDGVAGRVDVCLAEIVGAAGSIVSVPLLPLQPKPTVGEEALDSSLSQQQSSLSQTARAATPSMGVSSLTIYARRMRLGTVVLRLAALNLRSSDIFQRKCDACVVINRDLGDGEHIAVAQTEVVKANNSPDWKAVTVDMQSLCSGDLDRSVILKVYDAHRGASNAAHKIGQCSLSLRSMLQADTLSKDLLTSKGKKVAGSLVISKPQLQVEPDSFDAVCMSRLAITVAIDFTASNGHYLTESSLHAIDSLTPNPYQSALMALLPALVPFAHESPIHMFGFGGRRQSQIKVSSGQRFFPMLQDAQGAAVYSTQDALDAYARAVLTTDFGGNTDFAPIIRQVISAVEGNPNDHHVLLILSDGDVSDVEDSMDAVVAASNTRCSILVANVGFGDAPRIQQFLLRKVVGSDGRVAARSVLTYASFNRSPQTAVSNLLSALLEQWVGDVAPG